MARYIFGGWGLGRTEGEELELRVREGVPGHRGRLSRYSSFSRSCFASKPLRLSKYETSHLTLVIILCSL